jgi:amidase
MPSSELCHLSAVELARLIRTRELSAAEVLEAHLEQIARTNPAVNAIITHTPEQARARAKCCGQRPRRRATVGAAARPT